MICKKNSDDQWKIAGIVSRGTDCGHPERPIVLVNVPHYREWIDDNTKKGKFDKVKKVGKLQTLKKLRYIIFNCFFFLLACNPACTEANRECIDGDCVCEDGYQEIGDDNDCEKGKQITDIEKNCVILSLTVFTFSL